MSINPATMRALNNLSSLGLQLNQSTQRLATGLRINRGADDPAGLISSEQLRAALAELKAESATLQRTDQVAATADGALGEISNQLNEARGIQLQLASSGGLSSQEKAPLEGQLDSILQSVDSISTNATFNGDKLLDGTLTLEANTASLDVASASTSSLGEAQIEGTTYTLDDITSNGALADDPEKAAQILDTAIYDVAAARGSIGAFQSNTIDPRIDSINIAIENLSSSESMIRDTDFAAEAINVIRLRTLSTATMKTLSIINEHQGAASNLMS